MEDSQTNILQLPVELIAKIFSYLADPIAASQVCSYFKLVATTQIRSIDVHLRSEKSDQIKFMQEALGDFLALKRLKLFCSFDVNNLGKSEFCNRFSEKLTQLVLREMTFLNPFFDQPRIFTNLKELTIENSDLSSCSNQISHFILTCCPKLKDLTISGCSGLEIESLNCVGQNLHQTQIENFQLLPTYSYFDVSESESSDHHWRIEKLKKLSIRSKLVVMKKNFVRNVIGMRNEGLKTLELIAELDLGEPLAAKIISNYPNLTKLSIGRGCSIIRNEDFSNLCNFYKQLKSFEFHFSQSDSDLRLKNLRRNESIDDLTLGLTKNISIDNVTSIAKCLPKVRCLNIALYNFSSSYEVAEFLRVIIKIFPSLTDLEFQRTGMSETIKYTAIKQEIDSHNLRHFDDIRNLN